jgi:hypothetical protein
VTRSFSLNSVSLAFALSAFPALGIVTILTTGCGTPAPAPATSQPATAVVAHDGHDDHDRHQVEGHDHAPGPHGGTIVDWGGGTYHVEFTVDHEKRETVAYILGADEKTPTPVKADEGSLLLTLTEPAIQVPLTARPLPGETASACSCFAGQHESLGPVREFAGTISGAIDGTPYAGDFSEEPHDHGNE